MVPATAIVGLINDDATENVTVYDLQGRNIHEVRLPSAVSKAQQPVVGGGGGGGAQDRKLMTPLRRPH